jgi:hypothetical protein
MFLLYFINILILFSFLILKLVNLCLELFNNKFIILQNAFFGLYL